jgi:DNA (cytosine-5)-methyltransferase 1
MSTASATGAQTRTSPYRRSEDSSTAGSRATQAVEQARLRSVELFAGGGGLALGLHRAGFAPDLVVESDPRCCDTLAANAEAPDGHTHGWNVIEKDVTRLTYETLDRIDLLSAGPPCQPFSIGGRLSGHYDERDMFPEVLRAARALKPRAILIENVRGLLFPRAEGYFRYLIAQLRRPSRAPRPGETTAEHYARLIRLRSSRDEYSVYWRVLNAADFGLAQVRPRLVIVCLAADEAVWSWPEPTHSRDALIAALGADEYWDEHGVARAVRLRVRQGLPGIKAEPQGVRWRTLRDLTRSLGPPSPTPDPWHAFVPGARLYRKHTGSPLDWPSKTIKAGVHGCPGGEHIVRGDDDSFRYMTVRECAALQGFPSDFILPTRRTWAMRQLGNAVPVTLATVVGTRLTEVLNSG